MKRALRAAVASSRAPVNREQTEVLWPQDRYNLQVGKKKKKKKIKSLLLAHVVNDGLSVWNLHVLHVGVWFFLASTRVFSHNPKAHGIRLINLSK